MYASNALRNLAGNVLDNFFQVVIIIVFFYVQTLELLELFQEIKEKLKEVDKNDLEGMLIKYEDSRFVDCRET
ncbi:hypothetical protein P8452_64562 [Trifolium repens]|nr:hypothetical protein P8452_64562 [Trifolium repens]